MTTSLPSQPATSNTQQPQPAARAGSPPLLPCPFCGQEGEVIKWSRGHRVICAGCASLGANAINPGEAADNWNTRTHRPLTSLKGGSNAASN